jgi:hypothetical protein
MRMAHFDATRGVIECCACRRSRRLDEAFTLWRAGVVVFAVCEQCLVTHDLVIRPTDAGIQMRVVRRSATDTEHGGGTR